MSPALIAVLPFIGALLPGLLIRSGRDVAAISCGTATLIALLGLCLHIPAIMAGEVITARIEWLPSLGLNANFRIADHDAVVHCLSQIGLARNHAAQAAFADEVDLAWPRGQPGLTGLDERCGRHNIEIGRAHV